MTAISENIKTAQAIPVIIEEEEDLVPTVTSEGEAEEEVKSPKTPRAEKEEEEKKPKRVATPEPVVKKPVKYRWVPPFQIEPYSNPEPEDCIEEVEEDEEN